MFSAVFRIFGWLILAGGVIIAITDATRSVAGKSLQPTGLGETLDAYFPAMAQKLAAWQTGLAGASIGGWPLANVIDIVKAIPVALLAAGLFLLIYTLASRKRETRHF